MSMFDNYPSPEGYIPNNIVKRLPEQEEPADELPRKEYNIEGKFIGYSWRHGDTLGIPYTLDEYIREGIEGKNIEVSILDHNRCTVHTAVMNGAASFNIPITDELSQKMLRGNYYLTVVAYDDTSYYVSTEYNIIVK